ncbi:hypothetical protein LSH36_256g03017 [Paralvinella palmiformis]|uniref:Uncharacterized protein n=1 Tax=Paralvinella palmiformis TaxID=53620 RepID=A0AAD9N2Z6_9ANNE|nr:hypothetical protein LSH36_256g03017 [Paralvinella palmiformis]
MSAFRDSPLESGSDGPDAVLIESGRTGSGRDSYGSSTPLSRSGQQPAGPTARDKMRCGSPGINGGAPKQTAGITQKTQIRVTKRSGGGAPWKLKYHDFMPPKRDGPIDDPEGDFKVDVMVIRRAGQVVFMMLWSVRKSYLQFNELRGLEAGCARKHPTKHRYVSDSNPDLKISSGSKSLAVISEDVTSHDDVTDWPAMLRTRISRISRHGSGKEANVQEGKEKKE